KDWHKKQPELFKKKIYDLSGLDTLYLLVNVEKHLSSWFSVGRASARQPAALCRTEVRPTDSGFSMIRGSIVMRHDS
ncbi:hypothetical protein, partial [Thiolapillus sp.]